MEYKGDRTEMEAWSAHQNAAGIDSYQEAHNVSLDGLPGLKCSGAASKSRNGRTLISRASPRSMIRHKRHMPVGSPPT
jgi:hypothetical protein